MTSETPEPAGPHIQKRVDESWKEQAAIEKRKLATPPAPPPKKARPGTKPGSKPDEADAEFMNFISGLASQALIHFGDVPHPMTGRSEKNADEARYMVDLLAMLREKTEGNLSEKEIHVFDGLLYDLQMRFVKIFQSGTAPTRKPPA
ncbi:MAG: DUF1844 domain-containing protein [Planctomycetota bacterium]